LDLVVPPHLTPKEVIARLGGYCLSKESTFGYPYPMAFVHKAVKISEVDREQVFLRFRRECLKQGISPKEFDQIFSIFHESLDRFSL
jgi:hypothetical protein